MTLTKAYKILKDHNVTWKDYFDLMYIDTNDIKLKQAIDRIKTFLTIGY